MKALNNKSISNLFIHASSGDDNDSFVGVKIKDNNVYFYYPQTYSFDENKKDIRNDILSVLRTISLTKTSSKEKNFYFQEKANNSEYAIDSCLWIINDYFNNGLYIHREKLYKKNQHGRIDWKKTIQNDNPIISNGNLVYKNIIVEEKINIANMLVEIHKYCIKKSIDYIGWLFNINSSIIQSKNINEAIKKQYILTLKKETNSTFDDKKRELFQHCINVIAGLDDREESKEFVYGVDMYYHIFERMIDCIFSSKKSNQKYDFKANWVLEKNNDIPISSSNLRPDTILEKDNNIFIIDSKYYKFGFTGNDKEDLPETSSIQKQIAYGLFVKNSIKEDNKKIYNVFMIPFNKNNNPILKCDENIQYVGYAESPTQNNGDSYEKIYTYLVDMRYVIETWNKYNHQNDVDELVESVLNVSNINK